MLVIERTEGILSCVQGNSKMMKLGLDRCIAKAASLLWHNICHPCRTEIKLSV